MRKPAIRSWVSGGSNFTEPSPTTYYEPMATAPAMMLIVFVFAMFAYTAWRMFRMLEK